MKNRLLLSLLVSTSAMGAEVRLDQLDLKYLKQGWARRRPVNRWTATRFRLAERSSTPASARTRRAA